MRNTSSILHRIFTLLSGTLLAQIVSFLLLPIIGNLYLPAEIGISEALIATVMLFSVGINGGFELAMMLPKEEKMAQTITQFALYISLFLGGILGIILLLFGKKITSGLHQNELSETYPWLPFLLFLEGVLQLLRYYFMRHNELRAISVGKVLNILTRNGLSILFAYFLWSYQGLIFAFFLGQIGNLLPFLYVIAKKRLPSFNWKFEIADFQTIWRDYGDFPKYGMASTWLNTAAKQLPFFLFPVYFLSYDTVLGNYAFACKVLGIPLVLSFIVGDIFYQKAAKLAHHANQELYYFSLKTSLLLIVIAIIPFSMLYSGGNDVFSYFLDKKYQAAGQYTQDLAPYFASLFVAIPLTYLIDVRRKLKAYLILNLVFLGIKSLLLVICGKICQADETILYFSYTGTLLNVLQIFYCLWLAKERS